MQEREDNAVSGERSNEEQDVFSRLLQGWNAGDQEAQGHFYRLVAQDIHRLASRILYSRNLDQRATFTTRDLVGEWLVRILKRKTLDVESKKQLICLSAKIMRDFLTDRYFRRKEWKKALESHSLDGDLALQIKLVQRSLEGLPAKRMDDFFALMETLEQQDKKTAAIGFLYFFFGHTLQETAELLGLSMSVVRTRVNLIKNLSAEALFP